MTEADEADEEIEGSTDAADEEEDWALVDTDEDTSPDIESQPDAHSIIYTKPGWMTLTLRLVRWAKADSSMCPPYVPGTRPSRKRESKKSPLLAYGQRTVLSHAPQMLLKAPLVLYEGLIPRLVFFDPVADCLTQVGVFGGGAVELIRESPKEAVTIADGVRSIETQGTELVREKDIG